MIVCVCNAINCRTVRHTVTGGASSVAGVFKGCGKNPQCGRCFPTIRGMINEHAPAAANAPAMMAAAAE